MYIGVLNLQARCSSWSQMQPTEPWHLADNSPRFRKFGSGGSEATPLPSLTSKFPPHTLQGQVGARPSLSSFIGARPHSICQATSYSHPQQGWITAGPCRLSVSLHRDGPQPLLPPCQRAGPHPLPGWVPAASCHRHQIETTSWIWLGERSGTAHQLTRQKGWMLLLYMNVNLTW